MNDYLTAYKARLERNHNALIDLAKEVIKADSEIEVYFHHSNKFQSSVLFFKGEQRNTVAFHEVPYYWSGCGYKEHGKYHSGGKNISIPFDANDVLKTFYPITNVKFKQHNEYFKSKKQYLKWYSFYKKFEI